MPIHDYQCEKGHKWEEIFGIKDEIVERPCPECGGRGRKIYTSPAVFKVDFRPGWDDGAGEYFNTKRERDTFLDKNDLRRVKD